MYPYFEMFGQTVSTYLLCAIIGFICALSFALVRSRLLKFHIKSESVFFSVLCAFIGALIGAKVFQLVGCIVREGKNPNFWSIENWQHMLVGVGVFYGGLIGGFIAVLIYIRKNKLDFWNMADILTPSVLLFNVFGRIGCFCAGCCYGIEAGKEFVFLGLMNAPYGVSLVPVQLLESGLNFLIFLILLICKPEQKYKGICLPIYIISYSIGRFLLEFFRGDSSRGIFLISTSQWISLFLLPIGIVFLKLLIRQNRRHGTEAF